MHVLAQQSEVLGHFIEGFPGGIVDGCSHEFVTEHVSDKIDAGVPARSHQCYVRMEQVGKDHLCGVAVCLDVVYGDDGLSPCPGDRLGGGGPDEKRTDEPRTVRHGDAVDKVGRNGRFFQGHLDDGHNAAKMLATGDFRNDTPEAYVESTG